jgi:nucleotide-binding universal stress UspA family protein
MSDVPQPLRGVVVATDFTVGARAAIQRVFTLSLADDARIELVHVIPRLPRKTSAMVRADAQAQLEIALTAAWNAAGSARAKLTIRSRLLVGPIPDTLVEHAKSVRADLLVIGRHGHRVVRDWFIGSTARRVAHRSSVPVLLVDGTPSKYRRPVAAIDPAHYPDHLLDTTTRLLCDRSILVRLVHAYHTPFETILNRSMSKTAVRAARSAVRSQALASLREIIARREDSHLQWKPVVRRGDPRTTVLEEARRRRADLIAVGTRGRSAISRALIGGVAELLIDAATCDVLVVPARSQSR